MEKDESDVESIVNTINSWIPKLYSKDQPLINLSNGKPASPEMILNVNTTYDRGVSERDLFIGGLVTYRDRVSEDSSLNYHSTIKKQVVITFQDKKKAIKAKSIFADEGESFADILCRYDGKILDYEFLFRWPITKAPWMICERKK